MIIVSSDETVGKQTQPDTVRLGKREQIRDRTARRQFSDGYP